MYTSKIILYSDPRSENPNRNDGMMEILCKTKEEFDTTIAIITNPAREIPQDSIVIEDAPPEPPSPEYQLRADVDYIAIMTGVDLNV